MPEVLEWQKSKNQRRIVERAVAALADGQLVAFPTETVYGIAANVSLPQAVERLTRCKGRPESKPLALAVRGVDQALEWAPGMSKVGRRLAKRCWPGPVTLVFSDSLAGGKAEQLTLQLRSSICPQGAIGLRCPAHRVILEVLQSLGGPLALTSANRSGEPDATSAAEVIEKLGEQVPVIVDDGPCRYRQASTVVQVEGASWKILREGVLSAATLERMSCCQIVFVCTGNTCRSPLAEVLFKKMLAGNLGCSAQELPRHGFVVLSAGLAAFAGARATREAIETAHNLGTDLSAHLSQPLTEDLLAQADFVVVMTRGHMATLADCFGSIEPQPRLLAPDGTDIPDPVGRDRSVYEQCARQIMQALEILAPEVQQA